MRWLLALAFVVFAVRPADACGVWHMTDRERKLDISWLINSASIEKGGKRLAALYLDIESKQGIRVVTSKQVVFDIKGDKIRRYGVVVGKIDADGTVELGKKKFTIELVKNATPKLEGMPDYQMTVKRGEDVVVESDFATALCAAMQRDPLLGEPEEQDRAEIRRRAIYYLEWREFGM